MKLDPFMKIAPGKDIKQQRIYLWTAKKINKYNVKYEKPLDKENFFISKYFCIGKRRDGPIILKNKPASWKMLFCLFFPHDSALD